MHYMTSIIYSKQNILVASFMVFLWMLGSVKNHWSSLPLHTAALEIVVSISFALKTKRRRNILKYTNITQKLTYVNFRWQVFWKTTKLLMNVLPLIGPGVLHLQNLKI